MTLFFDRGRSISLPPDSNGLIRAVFLDYKECSMCGSMVMDQTAQDVHALWHEQVDQAAGPQGLTGAKGDTGEPGPPGEISNELKEMLEKLTTYYNRMPRML